MDTEDNIVEVLDWFIGKDHLESSVIEALNEDDKIQKRLVAEEFERTI